MTNLQTCKKLTIWSEDSRQYISTSFIHVLCKCQIQDKCRQSVWHCQTTCQTNLFVIDRVSGCCMDGWTDGRHSQWQADLDCQTKMERSKAKRESEDTEQERKKYTCVSPLLVVPQCKGSFAVVISTDTLYAVRKLQSPAARNQQVHMYCTTPEFWHNHAVSHELLP